MNVHSKIKAMARRPDKSRIEKMEAAAIELIADKGYSGTSVAEIARRAGVSAGYLYSQYKSKEDLALSIYEKHINSFDSFIDSAIETAESVRDFTVEFVDYMFSSANRSPLLVRFLLLLIFDRNFNIPSMRLDKTREQCVKILGKGIAGGEINRACVPEDIYIVYFSIPLKFLENRVEKYTKWREITETDVLRVSELCLKALR